MDLNLYAAQFAEAANLVAGQITGRGLSDAAAALDEAR